MKVHLSVFNEVALRSLECDSGLVFHGLYESHLSIVFSIIIIILFIPLSVKGNFLTHGNLHLCVYLKMVIPSISPTTGPSVFCPLYQRYLKQLNKLLDTSITALSHDTQCSLDSEPTIQQKPPLVILWKKLRHQWTEPLTPLITQFC